MRIGAIRRRDVYVMHCCRQRKKCAYAGDSFIFYTIYCVQISITFFRLLRRALFRTERDRAATQERSYDRTFISSPCARSDLTFTKLSSNKTRLKIFGSSFEHVKIYSMLCTYSLAAQQYSCDEKAYRIHTIGTLWKCPIIILPNDLIAIQVQPSYEYNDLY